VYEALRDFQPLIAALIALATAIALYLSARRAVAIHSAEADYPQGAHAHGSGPG
jgi:hypothetical protein